MVNNKCLFWEFVEARKDICRAYCGVRRDPINWITHTINSTSLWGVMKEDHLDESLTVKEQRCATDNHYLMYKCLRLRKIPHDYWHGKTHRCWTTRPTKEEMENMPWEE